MVFTSSYIMGFSVSYSNGFSVWTNFGLGFSVEYIGVVVARVSVFSVVDSVGFEVIFEGGFVVLVVDRRVVDVLVL